MIRSGITLSPRARRSLLAGLGPVLFLAATALPAEAQTGGGWVRLLSNAGFERGIPGAPWSFSNGRGAPILVSGEKAGVTPANGAWMAVFGGTNGDLDVVAQRVVLPADVAGARFGFRLAVKTTGKNDPAPVDILDIRVRDLDGNDLATIGQVTSAGNPSGWFDAGPFDLTPFAGQAFEIALVATTNGSRPTFFFVDDANLEFLPRAGASDLSVAFVVPRWRCRLVDDPGDIVSVAGVLSIEAVAAAPAGLAELSLTLDDSPLATTGEPSIRALVDSGALAAGPHRLEARATDLLGQVRFCRIVIEPGPAPSISLLVNPDFEADLQSPPSSWAPDGSLDGPPLLAAFPEVAPASGARAARFVEKDGASARATRSLRQPICLPPGATTVTAWVKAWVGNITAWEGIPDRLDLVASDLFGLTPPVVLAGWTSYDAVPVPPDQAGGWTLLRADFDSVATGLAGRLVTFDLVATFENHMHATFVVDALGLTVEPLPPDGQRPVVTVDSPNASAVVPPGPLVVTGSVVSPSDRVGVAVDGFGAELDLAHAGTEADPFRWGVQLPQSGAGARILRVSATSPHGVDCVERMVTVAGESSSTIDLWVYPSLALAPVEVTFQPTIRTAAESWVLEVDFDGDGSVDAAWTSLAPPAAISWPYRQPGFFAASFVLRDGATELARRDQAIAVHSPAAILAEGERLWNELRSGFAAGDVTAALSVFAAGARPRYEFLLGGLDAPTMATIASEMGTIELAGIADDVVTFKARRLEEGAGGPGLVTFEILVVRDGDGTFRIVEF